MIPLIQSTSVSERRSPLLKGLVALAIFSLVFSLFSAFVSPVIAYHDPADGPEVAPIAVGPDDPVWNSNPGGNVPCPAGTTELRFDPTPDGTQDQDSVPLSDGSIANVEITVDSNSFWFIVDNGLAAYVIVKGTNASNVYDYTGAQAGFAGPGIAHDDGLLALSTDSVSHIAVCLIPLPKGSILIYKDDQTQAPVEGAEFSVTNSEDEEVGTITSDADGFGCLDDLPFGDYTVTETSAPDGWEPDPDAESVTVDEVSTCEARLDGPAVDDADATFTNTLLGSLLILKTDEGQSPLEDAVFTVEDQEGTFTSNADGVFCVDGLVFGETYTVTETVAPEGFDPADPQDVTVEVSGDCDSREDGPDATFVNTLHPLGSITVVKVFACEECETRTRGYYFNAADQHEDETNAFFDAAGGILANGILFNDVDEVQAYLDADISGDSDGENGLSARGQLTVQYLAAVLNVLRNGEDCDLGNRVYNNADSQFDGWTVWEILEAAEAAFGDDDTYSDQEIQEALNDINNSSESEENPLSCGEGNEGTLGDGFTFDLFAEADYPEGDPIDTGTTGDDDPGTLIFSDLELGTYVLVETAPEGMDCTIVDVQGGTLEDDGSVTVEVTEENADVVVTVVNDCEDQEEAEGSLLISKVDDDDEALAGASFWVDDELIADAADGADDGFVCIDGLDLDSEVTVSEAIAPTGYVLDSSEEVITISNEDDCAARMENNPSADWDVQFVNTPEEEGAAPTLVIDKTASTEVVHFVFNADGSLRSATPAQVTWTLTYNLTNGPVTNAVITDPLPDFLNFVSASNGGTFAAGVITWELGTLTESGSVSFVTTVDPDAPETGPIVNVATIDSTETAPDQGQDSIRITSEQVQAGASTPSPSVPDSAISFSPAGQPISIPVELMAVLFLLSLGGLAFANVKAARRRR